MAECEVAKEVINKRFRKDDAPGEMKPWEQHSAVISIPRYDYKAPASFLDRSFSGFLITCPISSYLALYLCMLHDFACTLFMYYVLASKIET